MWEQFSVSLNRQPNERLQSKRKSHVRVMLLPIVPHSPQPDKMANGIPFFIGWQIVQVVAEPKTFIFQFCFAEPFVHGPPRYTPIIPVCTKNEGDRSRCQRPPIQPLRTVHILKPAEAIRFRRGRSALKGANRACLSFVLQ